MNRVAHTGAQAPERIRDEELAEDPDKEEDDQRGIVRGDRY